MEQKQKRDPILKVEDLSVSYGQIKALKNANLEVYEGEIVVLIGANGAGKTTTLETILGINEAETGSIHFLGKPITDRPADKNVRDGLTLVPEGRGVFSSMSVEDNLLLGSHHDLHNVNERLQRVFESFPILSERKDQTAGTLSGGERQMLAIARALMSSPQLIMVDEPSIGLAPKIINDIFEILLNLHNEGYAILLSEQNAYMGLKNADRGYVLETGKVTLQGEAKKLLDDPAVREAYLGA